MESIEEVFKTELRKIMNDYADTVSTGGATDFPHYRHLVGVIEGLALAERTFLDLIDAANKQEDLDL
jgi:hypothetical protein|tara:strand:- start:1937 stop:2137 length:201 start_codon:yes stop_codon:yes gene_type:complete